MSSAVQEPDYEVVRKLGDTEMRRDAPCTVAEMLAGSADEAANWASPLLAGCILGKNKGDKTLAGAGFLALPGACLLRRNEV